jgi:anti-sigma B factor antagonist
MSTISYVETDDVGIITIQQARMLDDANLRHLQKELLDRVAAIEVKKLVLDFRLVEFVSSAGLGMLVRIKKRCTEREIALRLCSLEKTVAEAIRITGLNQLLHIEADKAAAIASLQK